jgi:hypothetical protein
MPFEGALGSRSHDRGAVRRGHDEGIAMCLPLHRERLAVHRRDTIEMDYPAVLPEFDPIGVLAMENDPQNGGNCKVEVTLVLAP